MKIQLF